MTRIDLDDLPPKLAKTLAALAAGDELLLVQDGAVVSRLAIAEASAPTSEAPPEEADMGEVLEHFRTMIEEEF
jgi:antitoxin (DNA-binding transcriptional repressor) of toxin-antitoxin stability system